MPRPIQMSGKTTAAGQGKKPGKTSRIPLIAWLQKRKSAREEAKAEADKRITERKAKNEEQIGHKLRSISFVSSSLPASVLAEKQFPEQPCGDIQFQILGAINRIENNTQDYNGLDIRKIDAGIYQIAFLAKQAIDGGNANSARAACHALSVTIGEIRDKIPSVPSVLQKDFIESAEKYIDVWIDYIANCTVLDGLQNNAKAREESIKKIKMELDKEKDAIAERLINDPTLAKQFEIIQNQTYALHGSTWTPQMIELYQKMLNERIQESSLSFEVLCHNQDLQNMIVHQRILATFLTKLKTIPQPQDPNLMNKFKALVDSTYKEAAEQAQQFEEIFQEMDRMDEEIEQYANAAGNVRARDAASKQLGKIVERAKKKQKEDFGIEEEQENDSGVRLYTIEELEKMKREREAKKAQQEQQKQAQQTQQVQQQVNVNRPRNTN